MTTKKNAPFEEHFEIELTRSDMRKAVANYFSSCVFQFPVECVSVAQTNAKGITLFTIRIVADKDKAPLSGTFRKQKVASEDD